MNKQALGDTKDGFQKRGNKWSYRYSVKDPITKRMKQVRISGFRTKEEAKADRIRREYEAKEGKYVSKSKETISDLLNAWFKNRQDLREGKFATLNNYRQMLDFYILPKLGAIPIQDITSETLEDFFRELVKAGGKKNRPLSHSTYRACVNVLSMGLNYAVSKKKLAFNPIVNVKRLKGRTKPIIAYSMQEIKLLLDNLSTYRLYAFFYLACHTGARRGELVALRWSDLNFNNQTLSINKTRGKSNGIDYEEDTTKNENGMRSIELSLPTIEILKAHKERQNLERMMIGNAWQDTGYIFTKEDGAPIDPTRPYFIFKRALQELNLRNEPLHVLRHTHITELLRSGISPHIVAFRVGDTVPTILETYASVIALDDRLSADTFTERVRSA
jgi:integrase